jgi:FkbM family methyltransferase
LLSDSSKEKLKNFYRMIPLKKEVFSILRFSGIQYIIPDRVLFYLSFDGFFKVKDKCCSFLMRNGYGRNIEARVFWRGVDGFDTYTIRIWMKLVNRSRYIFDVGANTGIYTIVAKAMNADAQVYSFEPIDRVYEVLLENIHINRFDHSLNSPVIPNRIALSDYTGAGEMYDLPVEHMYTASLNRNVHEERGQTLQSVTENVQVMRMDDYVRENNITSIDLIKIDVESHEPDVVRGMGRLLKKYQPTMIVEVWNNDIGRAIEKELNGLDYLYYAIDKNMRKTKHIRNDGSKDSYINYLICKKDVADYIGVL